MELAPILIVLGVLFLAALVLDAIGHIVHVPRVTLLMLLGALLGPPALDVLPGFLSGTHEAYAAVALTMVAFLLGGSLERRTLSAHGSEILTISLCVVITSVVFVAIVLMLSGISMILALALAGISAATAPAAMRDIIKQSGRRDRFASNVLGIVAIDDAWGLIAFSLCLMLAGALAGHGAGEAIAEGLWEAGGGIVLGIALGLPAAFLTGRLKPGEPSLLEALGIVLICAGAALHFGVSYLLAGMVAGVIVVNFAKHHQYPFHEIERIEWPFILLFFVMAGASLDIGLLTQIGLIGGLYIAARIVARLFGGWAGARLCGLSAKEGLMTGLALTPQAGVAIGMALVAADRFPAHAEQILAVTIASTIIFEIVGPFFAQFAMARVPEEEDE